jgi:predicted aspartyl protease
MRLDGAVFHRYRVCLVALATSGLSISPTGAFAACKLAKMAELPVTMSGSQPLISAKINGEDARFVADSGAFFSMITEASASEFKLKLTRAPFGLRLKGVGGDVDASIATVKVFTFAGIPINNVEFLVGGSTAGGSGSVGLLGQNFFRIGDVEYDLGKGIIRLMRAEGCGHAMLAYWVKPAEPLSIMDIQWASAQSPHTTGTAYINGAAIRVIFDTGARSRSSRMLGPYTGAAWLKSGPGGDPKARQTWLPRRRCGLRLETNSSAMGSSLRRFRGNVPPQNRSRRRLSPVAAGRAAEERPIQPAEVFGRCESAGERHFGHAEFGLLQELMGFRDADLPVVLQ